MDDEMIKSNTIKRGLCEKISVEDLLKIGFKNLQHFTIANSVVFDLGRHKQLILSSAGTPNEMLWICQRSALKDSNITDIICLHNYDFDGYLSVEKVKGFIALIKSSAQDY